MQVIQRNYPYTATDVMMILGLTDTDKLSFIEELLKQACEFIERYTGYSVVDETIKVSLLTDGVLIRFHKIPDAWERHKVTQLNPLEFVLASEEATFEFKAREQLKPFVLEYIRKVLNGEQIDDLIARLLAYKLRMV